MRYYMFDRHLLMFKKSGNQAVEKEKYGKGN